MPCQRKQNSNENKRRTEVAFQRIAFESNGMIMEPRRTSGSSVSSQSVVARAISVPLELMDITLDNIVSLMLASKHHMLQLQLTDPERELDQEASSSVDPPTDPVKWLT